MKKFSTIILAVILSAATFINAQSVGINADGSTPETSAMLDVKSTDKGFLAPRMTAEQRIAITTPAAGLLVYQTDGTEGYYYRSSFGWSLVSQWTTGMMGEDISYTGNAKITGRLESTGFTCNVPNSTNYNVLWFDSPGNNTARIYTDSGLNLPGDLVLGTYPNGHMNQLYLKQSNTFVGIGTTTPAYKLDVAGDVNVTGNFKVNGTDISTSGTPTSYAATGTTGVVIGSTTILPDNPITLMQLTNVPAGTYAVNFSCPVSNNSTSSNGINLCWAITANDASPGMPYTGVANSFIPASGWVASFPFGQSGYNEVTLASTGTIEVKVKYYGSVSSGQFTTSGTPKMRAIKL